MSAKRFYCPVFEPPAVIRSDRCRACGYDLRATPTCCPECGTTPARPPLFRNPHRRAPNERKASTIRWFVALLSGAFLLLYLAGFSESSDEPHWPPALVAIAWFSALFVFVIMRRRP